MHIEVHAKRSSLSSHKNSSKRDAKQHANQTNATRRERKTEPEWAGATTHEYNTHRKPKNRAPIPGEGLRRAGGAKARIGHRTRVATGRRALRTGLHTTIT